MSSDRRLKVLVSAFAFSPIKGSEFNIGWDYVRAIAEHNQVWVITRDREREETEQFLRQHSEVMPGVKVHHVPWTSMQFNFPLWEIPFSWMYRNWQWQVYQLARKLHSEVHFDLIHHVCATGFREPGYLWKIDAPFVWGPVGGLHYFPVRLLNAVPWRTRPFFLAKNLANYLSMHSRRPRKAATAARLVIAGTSESAGRISKLWGREATVLCEVHSPEWNSAPSIRHPTQEKFRIIWSGNLEPRKALNIVLLALQRLKASNIEWELICLGDGPLEKKWKKLSFDLGIADRCKFLGRLPRAEAMSVMASGHCFVQPSLYDATSSVIVEALAVGLPVVCLDHFGFKDVVDSNCGVRIRPGGLEQVVRDFAVALRDLALNEEQRYRKALAAQTASVNYTWRSKANALYEIYESTSAGSGRDPIRSVECAGD